MAILIESPWLALAVAGLLLVLFLRSRSRLALMAATFWLTYAVYEYGMKYRLLCSGECNIRIDLLAIYPFLLTVFLLGLVGAALAMLRREP